MVLRIQLPLVVMSTFKVIIGGHSNLPENLSESHNAVVKVCKLRGAKCFNFWSHPTFKSMREDKHDLAILFLG